MTVDASSPRTRVGGVSGRIKGAAFREFLSWYEKRHGRDALPGAAESLGQAELDELDPKRPVLGIIASNWYSASTVHALLEALTGRLSAEARRKLADEGAAAVMDHTLRGIYRVLFTWMASPERYAQFGPKLWSAYYDSGRFEITMPEKNVAVATVSAWATHHPFICDLNRGAAAAIYVAMGCEDVTVVREACVADGKPHCRFVTRWRSR